MEGCYQVRDDHLDGCTSHLTKGRYYKSYCEKSNDQYYFTNDSGGRYFSTVILDPSTKLDIEDEREKHNHISIDGWWARTQSDTGMYFKICVSARGDLYLIDSNGYTYDHLNIDFRTLRKTNPNKESIEKQIAEKEKEIQKLKSQL